MTRGLRWVVALAVIGLAVLCIPLAACGGGGGGGDATPNNWDAMLWDTGVWQ
jgi:hypothetical protein